MGALKDVCGMRASKPMGALLEPLGTDPTTAVDKTNGVTLTSDYTPDSLMIGLLLTAGSGNLDIIAENGSELIFPVTVDSGNSAVVEFRIKTIKSTSTTTFSGHIFPLF
jgi:hypothetical protein